MQVLALMPGRFSSTVFDNCDYKFISLILAWTELLFCHQTCNYIPKYSSESVMLCSSKRLYPPALASKFSSELNSPS